MPPGTRAAVPPAAWSRLAALVLVAATLLAYLPAMQGGFVWDDDDYVTDNVALRSVHGLLRIWTEPGAVPQYYPLTFSTLWLEYQLVGPHPTAYHVTNVVLHAAGALVLWRVLVAVALPGAWLGAALFALHPVHVESVAWIAERKNVLSGLLYLSALLAYLRFAGLTPASRARRRHWWAALALFVGALLAKTVTCSLPAVLVLLLWWRRGRVGREDLRPLVPFFAVGVALALVTVWVERQHVGAVGPDFALRPAERLLIAGRALWFYARTLAWPATLTFIYPRWRLDVGAWWQWLFPLSALAVVAALFAARGRIGRGPVVAVLAFAVTLVPALGFVDVYPMRYSFVADHFQYLASIGLLALAAAGLARLRGGGRAVPAVALLALAALTWRQGHAYAGAETLWRDTIAKNPGAVMAHINLGILLDAEGRTGEAIVVLEQALRVDPADPGVHNDLGMVLARSGRPGEGLRHLEEARRLAPDDPSVRLNLGNALAAVGRLDDARAEFDAAVRLRPAHADAHNNLANLLAAAGRTDEAIARYREAIRLDPRYAAPRYNLAVVLAGTGRADEALAEAEAAIALDRDYADAHRLRGQLLALRRGGAPGDAP